MKWRACSPMSPERSIKTAVTQRISGGGEPDPERSDQGKKEQGAVRCRERLGGLLKYYEREAA